MDLTNDSEDFFVSVVVHFVRRITSTTVSYKFVVDGARTYPKHSCDLPIRNVSVSDHHQERV